MSNFIPVEAEGEQFYIEVLPAAGQAGIKQRSRDSLSEKLTRDDFKQMIRHAVMPACQTFVDVWQELNQPLTAESAEVEFNLGFTASGSAVIVQASGQASFKVKVTWKFVRDRSWITPPQDPNKLADWLSSEVGHKYLSQANLDLLKAFSKIFQILPKEVPSHEEQENSSIVPPSNSEELVDWLTTDVGKKYVRWIDPEFLQAALKVAKTQQGGPAWK